MPAVEPLCHLMGVHSKKFSKKELILLEAELFVRFYHELLHFFKSQYQDYFRLFKFNQKEEEVMIESNFLKLIIEDILLTEEYNLSGIAHYTMTHEDVLQDIMEGYHRCSSASLLRKIVELHRTVRPAVYQSIIKKITEHYLTLV